MMSHLLASGAMMAATSKDVGPLPGDGGKR